LGHCLFYEFHYYMQHPLEIILPWRGIPGQVLNLPVFRDWPVTVLLLVFSLACTCLQEKLSTFFWILDKVVLVTALGGFLSDRET